MNVIDTNLNKALRAISPEVGILSRIARMPVMNQDPNLVSYGIWPSRTKDLGGEDFGGRCSGCGSDWEDAFLGTVGETVERYACAFYNLNESIKSSYNDLKKAAVHPSEFALFHPKQHAFYQERKAPIAPFTTDTELHWFPMTDLTTGKESWCPGSMIYMPWTIEPTWVNANTSTGLAAHTDRYKAILTGLYEVIERDSFVLTWTQRIVPPKIRITSEIQAYLDGSFPTRYEWHFFDITYDIKVPSVFGICFGEAEFGKFVAVGTSTRATYGQALQKVVKEIGQGVTYFRYLLGEKKDWKPTDNYNQLLSFEDHSIFYVKRPDMWHVFDAYRDAPETKDISLYEKSTRTDIQEVRHAVQSLKDAGCNVLFKDISTPDIRQLGFYSIKVFVPQLIALAGAYPFYYHGGKRLYEVPTKMGYQSYDFDTLNKYPHPFP